MSRVMPIFSMTRCDGLFHAAVNDTRAGTPSPAQSLVNDGPGGFRGIAVAPRFPRQPPADLCRGREGGHEADGSKAGEADETAGTLFLDGIEAVALFGDGSALARHQRVGFGT